MVEYLEWMRGTIASLATATFNQQEIAVPVSRTLGKYKAIGLAIHRIEWFYSAFATVADQYIAGSLTKKSKTTAPVNISDTDCIDCFRINGDNGLGPSESAPVVHTFYPPILIANDKIYAQFMQNSGAAMDFTCRIGYTVRYVTKEELMEALID